MRKISVFAILVLTLLFTSTSNLLVFANNPAGPTDYNCYYYGFNGSTNAFRHRVSSIVDKETNSPSGIEWDFSTIKGLNMYFSIHDVTTGERLKEVFFANSDAGCYTITNTNTMNGGRYQLRSRRQFFWDLIFTRVSGSWRP